MRIPKKIIESRFRALCDALGKKIATSYNDPDTWRLDHTRCYGGYQIESIDSEGKASGLPFGPTRFNAEQLETAINFALRAIQIDRNGPAHVYWPEDKITNEKN